jgi:hypothetical protein
VTRTTRNIALGLLGSAMLFGCCCLQGIDSQDEPVKDNKGQVVGYHRHYYYRPWFWSSGGRGWHYYTAYDSPHYGGSSYSSTGRSYAAPANGGSRPSSGVTSHGGFGSTGHSTAGS